MDEESMLMARIETMKLRAQVESLLEALMKEQQEVKMLRELLGEAAWYVERYGDDRKDRRYHDQFLAASKGEPIPNSDDYRR